MNFSVEYYMIRLAKNVWAIEAERFAEAAGRAAVELVNFK